MATTTTRSTSITLRADDCRSSSRIHQGRWDSWALYNFGAGEIVEVKPVSGSSLMLPFEGESVVSVDVANGRVVLAPPAGFLDDETSDENSDENKADQKDG